MHARLCEPDCPLPGAVHIDPAPDWIGDSPITHGESDRLVPGSRRHNGLYWAGPDMYCLCGHPDFMTCPGMWRGPGTVFGLRVES